MEATAIDLLAPVHRLSVARYVELADAGMFDREIRVELIDGVIVEMSPQGLEHALALAWLVKAIVPRLGEEHLTMPQLPAAMPRQRSMPEPDIWIARQSDVRGKAPLPVLVVEVAVSSLRYDRVTKARIYAQRRVPEYWIVNLADRVVEVFRGPEGERWSAQSVHGAGDVLSPLELPGLRVDVGELMRFTEG